MDNMKLSNILLVFEYQQYNQHILCTKFLIERTYVDIDANSFLFK